MNGSNKASERHCPICYGALLLHKWGFYCFECNVSYRECLCCEGVAMFAYSREKHPGWVCFQCHEWLPKEVYR